LLIFRAKYNLNMLTNTSLSSPYFSNNQFYYFYQLHEIIPTRQIMQ